jgi:hypothetical protein
MRAWIGESRMRHRIAAFVLGLLAAGAASASAQTPAPGWKAVVRIVPNPLPAGRCARIDVEMQAPDGYRETRLSNGEVMDQKRFVFTSTDNTVFYWQGNDPTQGNVCVKPGAPSTKSTIKVALPDGSSGQVVVTSLTPGQSLPPMSYPVQARLRPPGVPAPATVATVVPNATIANGVQPSPAPALAPAPAPGANMWKGIARVSPNPVPSGQCAGITMEVNDPERHRASVLSNGAPIDPSKFTYLMSDPGAFEWKGGDPSRATVCAKASPTAARMVLGVVTPDGIGDFVEVDNVPDPRATPTVASNPTNTLPNQTPRAGAPQVAAATPIAVPIAKVPTTTRTVVPVKSNTPSHGPPGSGKYLITITGLKCLTATLDDPLQMDGKGDEVYVGAIVSRYDRTTQTAIETGQARSWTYGDINGFDGRMQAGSRSDKGGIQSGDLIPASPRPNAQRTAPPQQSIFPMIIWEGTLTDGKDALAISPSVWEDDLNQKYYLPYVQAQFVAQGPLWQNAQILAQATQPVPAAGNTTPTDPTSVGVGTPPSDPTSLDGGFPTITVTGGSAPPQLKPIILGSAGQTSAGGPESTLTATYLLPLNFLLGERFDRPIGIASAGGSTAILPNVVLVLTREILENIALPHGRKAMILQIEFRDTATPLELKGDTPGDYVMYLSVEREVGT